MYTHLILSYKEQKRYLFGPAQRSMAYRYRCQHEFNNDKFVPTYAIERIEPLIPKLENVWRKVSFTLQPLESLSNLRLYVLQSLSIH